MCLRGVAYRYTEDKTLADAAKELKRDGKSTCSLQYAYDLRGNILRRLCVMEQLRRQRGKIPQILSETGKKIENIYFMPLCAYGT